MNSRFQKQSAFLISKIIIVFVFGTSVSAQKDIQIGLGTGYDYGALKNELISPLTATGASMPGQLFFRLNTDRSRHHLQVYYASRNLSSGGVSTVDERGSLQYAFHTKLAVWKEKVYFFGGVVFQFQGSNRNNLANGNSIGNNQRLELTYQLSPSIMAEMPIGHDKLSIQLWVAIFGYVIQEGYASSYPEQKNWLGPKYFQDFQSRISYSKYVSTRFDLRFDYQFQFSKQDKFEPIHSLNHQLIASLVYKIHKP